MATCSSPTSAAMRYWSPPRQDRRIWKIWIKRTLGLRRDHDYRSAGEPLVDCQCKGEVMSRCAIAVLVSGLLTFTCGTFGPLSTQAQEGTPTAGVPEVEIAPGVTFELLPSSEN